MSRAPGNKVTADAATTDTVADAGVASPRAKAAAPSRLEAAVAAGQKLGRLALYFGCWDRPGHYLHRPGGHVVWEARPALQGFPWTDTLMDGGLLHNGKRLDVCDGRVFWTCGGAAAFWYAFYWWDRSGDSRGASNSGLYVRGFGWPEAQQAFDYGCAQYPHVIARQRHPLVLQDPSRGSVRVDATQVTESSVGSTRQAEQSNGLNKGTHL